MTGPLSTGDVIGGRYSIEAFVGEGGMQFVYSARDTVAGRLVALKTPKNLSATKRFHRGAIVAARVNHPNVAKTFDYLEEGANLYLIEELIDGADLDKALLKRSRVIDPFLAAKTMHHLAKGIGAAHHAGVVHRDLKPTNVMVQGGFSMTEIKITDFGIAKLAGDEIGLAMEQGGETLVNSQTAVGAVPYMAPEAIETPKLVGPPADIWSLGAMIYTLMCGAPPYGAGLSAVVRIVKAEPPEQPAFLYANPQFATLSRQVMELALSCMRRDPADRPTADQLAASCGQLCYSVSPRREGLVKDVWHDAWGFIATGFAEDDVFFNKESVYAGWPLQTGDRVLFSSYEGGGAHRAHPVVKLMSDA